MLSDSLRELLPLYLDKLFTQLRNATLSYFENYISEYMDNELSELIGDELADKYQHLYVEHLYNAISEYITEDIAEHIQEELTEYLNTTLTEYLESALEDCISDKLVDYIEDNSMELMSNAITRQCEKGITRQPENAKYNVMRFKWESEYMAPTEEQIKAYCDSLDVQDSTKRKARAALTAYSEFAQRKGITDKPTEEDLKAFKTENLDRWKQTSKYVGQVRRFFERAVFCDSEKLEECMKEEKINTPEMASEAPSEDTGRSVNTAPSETVSPETTTPAKKKIQVGCYLEPEVYEVLSTLASVNKVSVGEILSGAGKSIAEKNKAKYEKLKAVLAECGKISFLP